MNREKERFIITSNIVDMVVWQQGYKYTVFLFDYMFWADNIADALQWMNKNFSGKFMHQGMLLMIEHESDTVLFTLRYS